MKPSEYYQMKRGKVKFTDDLIALKELDNNFISKEECNKRVELVGRSLKQQHQIELKKRPTIKEYKLKAREIYGDLVEENLKFKREGVKILSKLTNANIKIDKLKTEFEDLKLKNLKDDAKRLGKKADKIVAENKRCIK